MSLFPNSSASSSSTAAAAAGSSDSSSSDEASEGIVLFLSVSVLIGCLCRWLVKRFDRVPLPFTVLLLLVGVLMGVIVDYGGIEDNVFQDAILAFANLSPQLALYLFLPVLIFDSAFNVHYHLFMHSLWAALLLAFPGALICLFFTAVFARYVFDYGWSWAEALMLGSVLASTDPVAVVALLRELGSSHQLATLIEGESLLNDGSAFVVYLLMQSILLGGDSSARHLVGNLFQYSLGGPAFGLLFGLATVLVLETFIFRDAELEITLTIAAVYVCFWVADSPLSVSAVLAIVVLGLVMSKNRYSITPSVQPALRAVWDVLIFFTNILIFVLSGLIIADKLFGETQFIRGVDVGWLFLLYVLLHVVRFLSIVLFLPLFHRTNVHLTMREVLMVSWSGMRGGVSLILALITYLQPAYDEAFRSRLTFLVCGIVLLTLVVNGMTSRYVLQYLKLNKGTEESRLILNSALLHMRQQTAHAMRGMKDDPKFREVRWAIIRPFLPQKLIEEVKQETEETPLLGADGLTERLDTQGPPSMPAEGETDEPAQFNRRASTSRRSTGERRGKLRVSTGDSDEEADSAAAREEDERQMQELIFPPDHPIHRIAAQQREQEERARAEPGDVTLLMMPTVMYEKVMGPLPDEKDDRQDDEKDDVAALPLSTPRQPYSSSVRELRPLSVRRQPSAIHRRSHRQPTVSTLMSIFDEPTEGNDSSGIGGTSRSPAASPSRITLEIPHSSSITDPPPGPTVPPPPHPPASAADAASPHIWRPTSSSPLPRPLQPSHSRRRQLLHHRQLSSMGESRLWPAAAGLTGRKLSLLRELSVRFMTAMQADYARQFGSGLLSRPALRILTSASEKAIDSGSILSHWTVLRQELRCPPWLSFLYSSRYLLSSSDVSWYVRSFRSVVQHLMFQHLKVSVELTTAFLSANQRLETVLDAFPELSALDADAVNVIQRQVGYLQHKALAAWVDVCEGYSEAHSAVVTRHAAIMLLHFQQREIRSLHSTGMLEQREFDLIVALINAKLVRLDQRGLQMHMSTAVELLQQHPALQTLTEEQKRRLRQWMRAKRTRRWHQAHHTVWDKGQHCPGLILTVRGTMRVTYDYDGSGGGGGGGSNEQDGDGRDSHSHNYKHGMGLSKDEHKDGHGYGSGYGRGLGYGRDEEAETSNRGLYRQQQQQYASPQPPARSWSAALAHLLGRTSSSSDVLSPPHHSSPQQQQHDHSQPAPQSSTPHRYVDTKGRLSVVGAYEMLTGHSTLASCRTVTMAESFLLDGECVDVLMDEDEAMQSMVRWAADDIMKARWTHWALHTQTSLKHYHIPYLLDRAHVFRSKAPAQPQQRREAQTQQTAAAAAGMGRDDGSGVGHDGTEADKHDGRAERDEGKAGGDDRHGRSDSASAGGNADDSDEHKLQPRSQSPSQSQSQSQSLSLSHPQPQPQSQPSSGSPRRPSPSQHRISLRYNDVLLIIDGSAVGDGMTRRVKRSAAQQQQQSVLQPRPARQQKQPPSLPRAATSTAGVTTGLPASPPGRPLPPPSTRRPLYLGPCMLRHRQGQLLMSAHCLYCRWELRDEEIASLFPPPPRADMRQYARELGLQLRMSAVVGELRDEVERSTVRSSVRKQASFVSAASSPSPRVPAAATASAAQGVSELPESAATLTKLPSASMTSTTSTRGANGLTIRAPLLARPLALSELPSPHLGHYLGAAPIHHSAYPPTAAAQQQRQQRRRSLDLSSDVQLRAQQRQRRASTAAGSPGAQSQTEEEQAGDGQEEMVEVEESELEWDPSGAWSASHARHGNIAGNKPASRIFAFDIETANALTI